MKESGCTLLMFGLESGNQRTLNLMSKGTKLDDVEKIIRNLKDVGIGIHVYLIFGFPGETDEEAEDTLRFIEKNRDFLDSGFAHEFGLEWGSPIHTHYRDFGITKIKVVSEGFLDTQYEFSQKIKNRHTANYYCSKARDIFRKQEMRRLIKKGIDVSSIQKNYCIVSFNFDIDEIKQSLKTVDTSENSSYRIERNPSQYIYNLFSGYPVKFSQEELAEIETIHVHGNDKEISNFINEEPTLFKKLMNYYFIDFGNSAVRNRNQV